MYRVLADAIVAEARLHLSEGDCPTKRSYNIETLELALIEVAERATPTPSPASEVHALDASGLACSCHARFSTRWEAQEHVGIKTGGPLAASDLLSRADEEDRQGHHSEAAELRARAALSKGNADQGEEG